MVTRRKLLLPLLSSCLLAATGCWGDGGGGDYSGQRGTTTANCTSDKRIVVEAGATACGSGPGSTSHLIYFENGFSGCIEAGGVWYSGSTSLEARDCAQADASACRGGLTARTADEVFSFSCTHSGATSSASVQATSLQNARTCYQSRNSSATGISCG